MNIRGGNRLKIFGVLTGIALFGVLFAQQAAAQPTVKIALDPDIRDIEIGSALKEIWVQAEVTGNNPKLTWKFEGPGSFQEMTLGGIYSIPQQIGGQTAQATLTVDAVDADGNAAQDRVTLTLKSSISEPTVTPTAEPTATPTAEPTATPTAEPTATPTAEPTVMPTAEPTATPTAEPTATPTAEPTATPTAEPTVIPTAEPTATPTAEPTVMPTAEPVADNKKWIQEHLTKAERYMQQRNYATPAKKNAFEEYQQVLAIDAANAEARQGILTILAKYKTWGDAEFRQGRYKRARQAYQHYLEIAAYATETLQTPPNAKTLAEVKKRIAYQPTPTPVSCSTVSAQLRTAIQATQSARAASVIAPAECDRAVGAAANLLESSKTIRAYLTHPVLAEACFSAEETPELQARLGQIQRIIDLQSIELAQLSDRCQPLSANRACQDFEQDMTLLLREFQQAEAAYLVLQSGGQQAACDQQETALNGLIETLQRIRRMLRQHIAAGDCLTPEEKTEFQPRLAGIEQKLAQYRQEQDKLLSQCRAPRSCEELETLLALSFDNFRQDFQNAREQCQQRRSQLTALFDALRTVQQGRAAAGNCGLEIVNETDQALPGLEQEIAAAEEELQRISELCQP